MTTTFPIHSRNRRSLATGYSFARLSLLDGRPSSQGGLTYIPRERDTWRGQCPDFLTEKSRLSLEPGAGWVGPWHLACSMPERESPPLNLTLRLSRKRRTPPKIAAPGNDSSASVPTSRTTRAAQKSYARRPNDLRKD